ncbi:hypothetical protein K1719_046427 [Acacia pycnantha]|nr:hypothetical protein K1719_046427 [Acacia pycnantha]
MDEKDKRIQELTAELRNKKRLCATYQEQAGALAQEGAVAIRNRDGSSNCAEVDAVQFTQEFLIRQRLVMTGRAWGRSAREPGDWRAESYFRRPSSIASNRATPPSLCLISA